VATLGASADKSAQTSAREENVASSAVSRTWRFDLRVPAVQDLHADLLERPEVLAVELEKPKLHEPVAWPTAGGGLAEVACLPRSHEQSPRSDGERPEKGRTAHDGVGG